MILTILTFGVGLIVFLIVGASVAVSITSYIRFRRSWQLVYLICAISWIVESVSHYIDWFVYEQSGILLSSQRLVDWLNLTTVPIDIVVLPIWLLMLLGRRVKTSTVAILVGNMVVAVSLFLLLVHRSPANGVETTPLMAIIALVVILQTSGLYIFILISGIVRLRSRSIPLGRRRFWLVFVALSLNYGVGTIIDLVGNMDPSRIRYQMAFNIPIVMVLGFGYIAYNQVRDLIEARHETANSLEEFFRLYTISRRERDVVLALRSKEGVRDIARRLFVSEATVNTHIRNIYGKCGVHSRAELLNILRQYEHRSAALGLIDGEDPDEMKRRTTTKGNTRKYPSTARRT